MQKLKTGLIVLIFALVLPDWFRAHAERKTLTEEAEQAVAVAEWKDQQMVSCIDTLNLCKASWGSELKKAQMIVLTQAQTASWVRAAQNGDQEATTKLAELGWSWDTHRRVLQASFASNDP